MDQLQTPAPMPSRYVIMISFGSLQSLSPEIALAQMEERMTAETAPECSEADLLSTSRADTGLAGVRQCDSQIFGADCTMTVSLGMFRLLVPSELVRTLFGSPSCHAASPRYAARLHAGLFAACLL